jgi:hypothetical protein
VLQKFPDVLRAHKIRLPSQPDLSNLDYPALQALCLGGDLPVELDDVLAYVNILGTTPGWERIQQEARAQGRRLDFPTAGLTHADLVMQAWLHDWPNNRTLPEESYMRVLIHARSSYVYFPAARDVRAHYRTPTAAVMQTLQEEISAYFIAEQLGKGAHVVMFDFEQEVWFLIRYPGQLKRHMEFNAEGTTGSRTYKPEEYDAVIYHKHYGDLRVNTNRARNRVKYRILFGHALLKSANVFVQHAHVITLEPLKGRCLELFNCADIPGLAEISPIEVTFHELQSPGREIVWRAEPGSSLLLSNRLAPLLLPDTTDTIHRAIFRYRLRDRQKTETLTVHQGSTMTYERDGDSAVLEEWLRLRKFVKHQLTGE